jgi:hypothetical protein
VTILDTDGVARLSHDAGFTGEALVTAVAVAKAESGFRTDAVGDVGLADDTFGPSIGLFQIRSLHAERGTGGVRDELANLDPAHNARSAFSVSGEGTNFRPWSVFLSGAYERHLDAVRPACISVDPTVPVVRVAPAADGMLRQGDRGPAVADLQRRLTEAGFPCSADGEFGPLTAEAVRAFQASRNLDVDAVVGPRTQAELRTVSPALR